MTFFDRHRRIYSPFIRINSFLQRPPQVSVKTFNFFQNDDVILQNVHTNRKEKETAVVLIPNPVATEVILVLGIVLIFCFLYQII